MSIVWGKETDALAVTRGVGIAEEAPALYLFSVDEEGIVHVDFRDIASYTFSDCNKRYPPKAPPDQLHERRVSMTAKEFHSRDTKLEVLLELFSRPYPRDRWKYSVAFDLAMSRVDFLDGEYTEDVESTQTALSKRSFHGPALTVNPANNTDGTTGSFQITVDRRQGLPGSGVVILRDRSEKKDGDYSSGSCDMPLMVLSEESPVFAWTLGGVFAVCAGTTAGNLKMVVGRVFLDEKRQMHVSAKYLSDHARVLVGDSFGSSPIRFEECSFEEDGELLTVRCVSTATEPSQDFLLRYGVKSKRIRIDQVGSSGSDNGNR